MTTYQDFAEAAATELSGRVRAAVSVRLFALAFWQEAARATAQLAPRGVALRFEPLALDGFSLGYGAREVWVTRESDYISVMPQGALGFLPGFTSRRCEPPETPEAMRRAAEVVMGDILRHILERSAF